MCNAVACTCRRRLKQRRPCGPAQHETRVLEEAVDDEEAVPNVVVQDLLGPLGTYCQQGQLATAPPPQTA